VIVTISRQYGAGGLDVAHRVGELLGYPVAGEDLPKIAALRLGTTQEEVVAVENTTPSIAERILQNLGTAVPDTHTAVAVPSFESEVRKEIEAVVLEAAQQPNVVIVGGVANAILHGRANVLSAFLRAPMAFRIDRIVSSFEIGREAARKEIERVDAARRRWAKVHYDMTWGAPEHYSLVIDLSRFGVEGAARLIAHAAGETA
jgi:cytidylate kinase